jgi:hypothetical protein
MKSRLILALPLALSILGCNGKAEKSNPDFDNKMPTASEIAQMQRLKLLEVGKRVFQFSDKENTVGNVRMAISDWCTSYVDFREYEYYNKRFIPDPPNCEIAFIECVEDPKKNKEQIIQCTKNKVWNLWSPCCYSYSIRGGSVIGRFCDLDCGGF